MKRVLVAGGSGLVGRHTLAPLIARGFEVHAVARKPGPAMAGVAWHGVDLLDEAATRTLVESIRPTDLLHTAWSMTPGRYASSLDNVAWVRATLNLLEAFVAVGGRRAVVTGTCFEYDHANGVCTESTRLAPSTLYGWAKVSLHLLTQAYAKQAGFTLAWARIFYVYGPHEHPSRLVASVVRSLLLGEPARCSHGNQLRDYLHVADVGEGLVALLESGVDGPVNIGAGAPVRLKDIIYAAADAVGRRDLVQLGAVTPPPDEPPLIVADVTRMHDVTQWRPTRDLQAGIEDTIAWWRGALGADPVLRSPGS